MSFHDENGYDEFDPSEPSHEREEQRLGTKEAEFPSHSHLRDLILALKELESKIYSFSKVGIPAEVVFELLKESLYIGISIFREEHTDVKVRNKSLILEYKPEKFHSMSGTKEIDTGLPQSRMEGPNPRIRPANEAFVKYFQKLLIEILKLEKEYQKIPKFRPHKQLVKEIRRESGISELKSPIEERKIPQTSASVAYFWRKSKSSQKRFHAQRQGRSTGPSKNRSHKKRQ